MTTNSYRFIAFLVLSAALPNAVFALDPPPGGFYPDETTALGQDALFHLAPDSIGQNTAIGYNAMYNSTYGGQSVAVGDQALFSNTIGGGVAVGYQALYSNTTGEASVAVGTQALVNNTTGFRNVAVGTNTLLFSTTANYNTAVGDSALSFNTTGSYNTALGAKANAFNSTGHDNAAVGYGALNMNTTGFNNTALGDSALGFSSSGSNNIVVGYYAGTVLKTGDNNIEIGHVGGSESEANTIRIGTPGTQTATYMAGIRGVALGGIQQVGVNAKGQLGVRGSSARFKEAIKPMGGQSDAILSLRPVSFRYKKELDPSGDTQFGLVAEEVAKVAPELVMKDASGKPFSVRYEEVNAMLLNEFLKEHKKSEQEAAEIAQLKAGLAKQQAAIEALTKQMQKVSAHPEASESKPLLTAADR